MNARQKAKYYKKKYEECLNKPVKVIEKTRNLQKFKCKQIYYNMDKLSNIIHSEESCKNAIKEMFMQQISREFNGYLKDNNITIRHSKQAGLDILESEIYLAFDKEGMVDDL